MEHCLNLARLSKSNVWPKSLNQRGTTPATSLPGRVANRRHAVDPTHPSTNLPLRAFPYYQCPEFTIRAVPKAALIKGDYQPPSPTLRKSRKKGQLDISLLFQTFKKLTHKRTTLRRRMTRKITTAISLVVTRGVDVASTKDPISRKDPASDVDACGPQIPSCVPASSSQSTLALTVNPTPIIPSILKDWTYVITPKLQVYRAPYANIVDNVRKALLQLSTHARRMEATWTYKLSFQSQKRAPIMGSLPTSEDKPSSTEAQPMRDRSASPNKRYNPPEKPERRVPSALSPRVATYQKDYVAHVSSHEQERPPRLSLSREQPSQDSHTPSFHRGIPKVNFPSQHIIAPSSDPKRLDDMRHVAHLRTRSAPGIAEFIEKELTAVHDSKDTRSKGLHALRLDLPDRFSDISWREFDTDVPKVDALRRRSRSQHTLRAAQMARDSVYASRQSLTTPKPERELSDGQAVTESVAGRIYTSKPVFLPDLSPSKKRGS